MRLGQATVELEWRGRVAVESSQGWLEVAWSVVKAKPGSYMAGPWPGLGGVAWHEALGGSRFGLRWAGPGWSSSGVARVLSGQLNRKATTRNIRKNKQNRSTSRS